MPLSEKSIKMKVFPADDYQSTDIRRMLDELSSNGLIGFYEVENRRYLRVSGWIHQKIDKPSYKYPQPSGEIPTNKDHFLAMRSSNARRPVADHSPPDVDVEGKGEEGNTSSLRSDVCAEPEVSPPDDPIALLLPTNKFNTKGEEFAVTHSMVRGYAELYPSVDIGQHLRNMRGWLISNSDRRKTKGGMPKFINAWLAKEQNRGGSHETQQRIGRSSGIDHEDTSWAESIELDPIG